MDELNKESKLGKNGKDTGRRISVGSLFPLQCGPKVPTPEMVSLSLPCGVNLV